MKTGIITLLFLLTSFLCIGQSGQIYKYSETITIKDLKRHMEVLSSDEYEGRDTGSKGQKLAAEYIKNQFKEFNLSGPSPEMDPYFQEFDLSRTRLVESYIDNGETKLASGIDFSETSKNFSGDLNAEVVFMGYGLDQKNYSDYKDLNVEGKIVAYFIGEPKGKDGKFLTTGTVHPSSSKNIEKDKIKTATSKGAVGVIRIGNKEESANNLIKSNSRYPGGDPLSFKPISAKGNKENSIIFMKPSSAANLFGIKMKKLMAGLKKLNKGNNLSGKYVAYVHMLAKHETKSYPTENVVGYIEGTDKKHEDNPDYVYQTNSGYESSYLHELNISAEENVHSELVPEYQFVENTGQISGGSDHYPFFQADVPVIYFRCGIHEDYHKPSDTVEKINFKNFFNITRLVFSTTWEVANASDDISIEE